MKKYTHVIAATSLHGMLDSGSMTYINEQAIQGLQHAVSATLHMCKPDDPIEVLDAIEAAYDLLKLLQLHCPIEKPMLI